MGKNLIQQRRGRGTSTFRVPSFRFKGKPEYGQILLDNVKGKVADLVKCAGHSSPLMEVDYENGDSCLLQAPEGIRVGESVAAGENAEIKTGNVLALKSIPEGT